VVAVDADGGSTAAGFSGGTVMGVLRYCLITRLAESGAQPESRRGLVLVGLGGFAALLVRWLIVNGES